MYFETERLILKPYEYAFEDVIYPVVAQREVADTMIMIPHPYPRKAVSQWIEYLHTNAQKGTAYEFAIFLKENPEKYIGNCGLVSISKEHKKAEIAYFIDHNEWGNGYATEAARCILDYGFQQLKLERIYGRCMTRNKASRVVMEKLGFIFEGRFKHDIKKGEVFEDIDYLAIIRSMYLIKK